MSEDIEKILFKATDLHVHHGRDLIVEYGFVDKANVLCSDNLGWDSGSISYLMAIQGTWDQLPNLYELVCLAEKK